MSKPTIEEQIEALVWLRKGWNGDNSERAIEAFNTLDDGGVFAALDQERNDREARPMISTQSAMDGKIYRSDGSVLPVPGSTEAAATPCKCGGSFDGRRGGIGCTEA